MFYGLPIHIMRDLFMTARSFLKRLTAFARYRNATKDMNSRYEDATVADIQREDTCIICREEMRPWSVTNPQAPPVVPGALPPARPAATINEKTRPKRLPCGHILHLGCLKSWLERQQVCPTCRRPVDSPPVQATTTAANNANPAAQAPQPPVPRQANGAGPPAPPRAPARGMRMLNIGPLRVGFGQANLRDFQQMGAPQAGQEADPGPRVYGLELGFPRRAQPQAAAPEPTASISANAIPEHLQRIEQHIAAEIRTLQASQQELQIVQLLQTELARLRLVRNGAAEPLFPGAPTFPGAQLPVLPAPLPTLRSGRHAAHEHMQRHRAPANPVAIPSGSADLPPGVTIPEGWSLLPLQRLDSVANVTVSQRGGAAGPATTSVAAPTSTTTQPPVTPVVESGANDTLTPSTRAEENVRTASTVASNTSFLPRPSSPRPVQSTVSASEPTVPDSSTGPSASTTIDTQGEPSSLPNWGSSQLFSTPTLSSSMNEGDASSTPPLHTESVVPAMSSEEGSGGKGKARAVTMEDTEDEAEGM